MTLQRRLKKLEQQLDTSTESVDRLIARMQTRAELNMMPALEEAIERGNEAARAAGLPERDLPELSEEARQLAETDSPEQAAADQKRWRQLVHVGAVDGEAWRAKNGGITPDPNPVIEEARRRRDQRGADGGAR